MDAICIPLTRGFETLVDGDRFEESLTCNFRDGRQCTVRPSSMNWMAKKSKCHWYPIAFLPVTEGHWCLRLPRLLTQAPSHLLVDHRNGDTMDNRLENLRTCTTTQNRCNSRTFAGANGFKGVRQTKDGFRATLKIGGRSLYLGTFTTAEEAAKRYDLEALERFGEFARTNFPQEAA